MIRRFFYYSLILWGIFIFHAPQLWLMYFLYFKNTGDGGMNEALINAGLILLWGFIHSILARPFAKKAIAKIAGDDFVKLVYITIAGITQCLLLYFWQPLSGVVWETHGIVFWILTVLFFASLSMVFISSLILDYMEVLGIRKIIRRMRNEPDKSPDLIVKGPYAFTRNPVYLSTIFFLWVGPVMTMNRLEFAVIGTVYVLIGTYLEDRDTKKAMGESYKRYSENVPLIIPRLTPWKQ